jgi:hypothetical protein
MFSKNVLKIFIVIFTLFLFCTIFFTFYRKVEAFLDVQQQTSNQDKVSQVLVPITNRLCPLLTSIQKTIAKNSKTASNVNSTPTQADSKRAYEDTKVNTMNPPEPVLNQEDLNSAFSRMLKESQHLLISCPPPTDMTLLPSTIADDIYASLVYATNKLVKINKQYAAASSGELVTGQSENEDDPYTGLSPANRIAAEQKYANIMATHTANQLPPTVSMSLDETEALLNQRLSVLNSLLSRKNSNGDNELESLLSSGEKELSKLKNVGI